MENRASFAAHNHFTFISEITNSHIKLLICSLD
jgi:hypothetical protein